MILLLRLLFVIVTGFFKPRIGVLDTASVRLRVWPNDIDLNMHMNSGRYVSMMDVGRVDLLVRYGLFREVIFGRGWRPIAGGSMVRFRRSLLTFERFTLKSRVLCWDEKWFYFEHVIERMDGQLAAISYVRGLIRSKERNIAPRELLELAGKGDVPSPPMPPHIARWNEAEALAA